MFQSLTVWPPYGKRLSSRILRNSFPPASLVKKGTILRLFRRQFCLPVISRKAVPILPRPYWRKLCLQKSSGVGKKELPRKKTNFQESKTCKVGLKGGKSVKFILLGGLESYDIFTLWSTLQFPFQTNIFISVHSKRVTHMVFTWQGIGQLIWRDLGNVTRVPNMCGTVYQVIS